MRLKDRNNSISMLRFISMLFIVICHFFQYYDNKLAFYFNVGVQIFLVISGYLYSQKEIDDPIGFFKKNAIKILVPYYVFLIPVTLLYFVFCPQNLSTMSVLKAFVCADTISGLGHLWFVGYILFCYLITPYLFWFSKKIKNDTIIVAGIKFCILIFVLIILGRLFNAHFDMLNICCYVIGYFIGLYQEKCKMSIKIGIAVIAGIASLTLYGIRVYFDFLGFADGSLQRFIYSCARIGSNVIFSATIVLVFLLIDRMQYYTLLKISDKYSYYVYIVHLLFVLSPFSAMAITSYKYLNWIIVVICICLSSVVLYWLSRPVYSLLQKQKKV